VGDRRRGGGGSGAARVRSRSLWLEGCPDDLTPRPPLPGDTDVDVAIVGGGLTGLWTAHHLRAAAPDCRIVVVEAEVCGFGASGRNGGWCSALFPTPVGTLAAAVGRPAAVAQHRAMVDTVDRVELDLAALGIDAAFHRGGTLALATDPAHVPRLRAGVRERHDHGFGPDDDRWLPPSATTARMRVPGVLGAAYTPHCAAVDPARLVRGLARAVEAAGVRVHEGTRAVELAPGVLRTDHGTVRADVVLRCTEGYTATLPGHRRDLLPVYSMMIATEPLPPQVWDDIGLADRETFTDGRHLLVYGQRTADGRIAFGGRGAPYHFGSRITDAQDRDARVAAALVQTLHRLLPPTRGASVTHHWGGPLGVPRDWTASVGLDRTTGLGWAGGYVGDGVSTTHLAGRTLRDLVLGLDTELTRLPWVGHRSRRWEPEPLRWLGVNLGGALASAADRSEARRHRPGPFGRALERLTGGH
jgi:glycine/D-amino acid oxidase-like deaminating enzyme